MPKRFRDAERMLIEQIIIHCYEMGYSVKQTQDYLRIKKNLTLQQDRIYKVRNNYVNNNGQWLIDLAMDKTAFVALFHEKLQQLESYRRSLLDLIMPDPSVHGSSASKVSPTVHVQAIGGLHKLTMSIASLEKMLPLVSRFTKDMDVNDLIKLNRAWEEEMNPRGDIRGGEPATTVRPEYQNIADMVNVALHQVEIQPSIKDALEKKQDVNTNSPGTIPTRPSDKTFRPVL